MEAGLQPPATAGGPPSAPSAIEAAGWERISDAPNQTTPDPLAGLEALVPELLSEPDDDWPDESEADAVPTSSMPVPVSVPLYDFSAQGGARHTGRWIALGIVAALGAACAVCWKLGLLPLP